MPSGLEQLEGARFILKYEHPWGGVASNAMPQDIAPSQLVGSDGLFIKRGRLCSTNFYAFNPNVFMYSNDGTNLFWAGVNNVVAIYLSGSQEVAIVAPTEPNGYLQTYHNGHSEWILDFQIGPIAQAPKYICTQMIGGIIYIFDWTNGIQFKYTPMQSLVEGTWFVGGKYCMSLDRYLITCNTHMNGYTYIDSNGAQQTVNPVIDPTAYNWSAINAYTTFGPIAGDPTLDSTKTLGAETGFNFLADVQNAITGCFAMGNTGYILHDQGIAQLSPTGITNTPFDITTLWAGKDGVGCTFPDTLAVYAYIAMWVNNNNIYLFSSGAAPQPVGGAAKEAIFQDINQFITNEYQYYSVSGNIINMGVDNKDPQLVYNLYIVAANPPNLIMTIWSYVIDTQTWTRTVEDVTSVMHQITGNINYSSNLNLQATKIVVPSTFKTQQYLSGPTAPGGTGPGTYISPLYGGMIFNTNTDSFFLFQFINSDGFSSIANFPVTNLTFRAEEFQVYRKPTVRGVILRACGIGTLHIKVGDTDFSDIEVSSGGQAKLYRSFGMYTDQAPQLNITSTNFNGYIAKVHGFGTYAEGEPL